MKHARSLTIALLLVSAFARAQDKDQDEPGNQQVGESVPSGSQPRVIKPPALVKFVEAEYPEAEKASKRTATVVLQIGITETGKVAAVSVIESAGLAFDNAAMTAARQFVFTPAEVNGRPVPVKINYRYQFVIKEELVKRTTADFVGEVRDRKTKKGIPNITVSLDTGQSATTDADGKFTIDDVSPGEHSVTLTGEKLTPLGTQEKFEASKKVEAQYDVELKSEKNADDDEDLVVVVTAERLNKQVVSTEITALQAKQVPGTQGDVLKVVESMPGVARAALGSGQIVVWGAAPEDTRVYVDGVRIPRLYHDGGYRSVIHSDMVKGVELVPGGYSADFGRGLGGLIFVQLKPLDADKVHGSVAADTIDASAAISAPLGKNIHFAAALRKSYLDKIVKAVGEKDVQDIVPLPDYFDTQARVVYAFDKGESIEAGGLFSSDSIDRSLVDPDPALTKHDTRNVAFGRVWLRYEKKLKNGDTISVLPSWGIDDTRRNIKFGIIPSFLESTAHVFGLRALWKGNPTKWLTVKTGLDVDFTRQDTHRQGSVTTPPREGDVSVFGLPPSDQVNTDTWKTVIGSVAPFVEADFAALDDKLHVTPGLRVEPYLTSTNRTIPVTGDKPGVGLFTNDLAFEPRVSVRWQATPRINLKAAFGQYHQPPAAEDLSAVFGNPKLGLAFGRHTLAGAAVKLTKSLSADVTGFYNTMESLTSRNESPTPLLAQALVQEGIGRSYGVQVMLRQEQWGPFFGWISYAIIRSERRDHPDVSWRLFDYDQTHVLTAVGALSFGAGWEIGARFRFATGFPRTPFVTPTSYAYARTGDYYPVFGEQNSIRIPAFWQLDARVAKHFKIAKTDAEIYLDVQNVTNHQNAEEIVYNYNYNTKGYITGLPIYPVVGMKWTF